jgi:hypothetical protein
MRTLAGSTRRTKACSRNTATAQEMVGYRDLPMGQHDMQAMAHQVEPFKTFVQLKRNLLTLLQEMDKEDQAMLEEMDTK